MNDVNLIWNQPRAGGDFDHVMETMLHSAETLERWRCQCCSRRPDGVAIRDECGKAIR